MAAVNPQLGLDEPRALVASDRPTPADEIAFARIERGGEEERRRAVLYFRDRLKELLKLARRDALTGLWNRRYYDETMAREIKEAKRNGVDTGKRQHLSLLLIDIDHFKQVNDTWGHVVGDHVLQRVAKILGKTAKRPRDVVCRYGGEEFAVILPETDLEGAKILADTLRKAVEEETESSEIRVTVTVGCSTWEPKDSTEKTMKDQADDALYFGKRGGRNQVCVFHPTTGLERFGEALSPNLEAVVDRLATDTKLLKELGAILKGADAATIKELFRRDPQMRAVVEQALTELGGEAA